MGKLRNITIHVVESKPREFRWVLSEIGAGDRLTELQKAPKPLPTYQQAMASGLYELQNTIEDLDRGPRELEAEVKKLKPAATASVDESVPEEARKRGPKQQFFGFGPIR